MGSVALGEGNRPVTFALVIQLRLPGNTLRHLPLVEQYFGSQQLPLQVAPPLMQLPRGMELLKQFEAGPTSPLRNHIDMRCIRVQLLLMSLHL